LILSDNNLHNLPHWISELTELKYLYIDNNLFEEIQKAIYTLNNIQMIYQIIDLKNVNNVVSL